MHRRLGYFKCILARNSTRRSTWSNLLRPYNSIRHGLLCPKNARTVSIQPVVHYSSDFDWWRNYGHVVDHWCYCLRFGSSTIYRNCRCWLSWFLQHARTWCRWVTIVLSQSKDLPNKRYCLIRSIFEIQTRSSHACSRSPPRNSCSNRAVLLES